MSNDAINSPYRTIPLTQGRSALIDADKYDLYSKRSWQFDRRYAKTVVVYNGKQILIRMHRAVLNAPPHLDVDHINHDMLDNRRENLRLCTSSQNLGNSGKRKHSKNQYKGITPWGNRWRARIGDEHIGMFAAPEEAAKAYDAAAIRRYGEFAWTNFPTASPS